MTPEMGSEDYIGALYRAILRRDPDPLGLHSHRKMLQESGPTAILASLLGSGEYRSLVGTQADAVAARPDAIADVAELVNRMDAAITVRKDNMEVAATMFSAFYFDLPEDIRSAVMQLPPASRESYELQMKLIFEPIAGHPHKIEMEGHDSSFMSAANAFPFYLAPKDAGYWTMAYGYFLNCLALPVGARVLEIGFGAGGLTEVMVRAGLNVTAVELRESNIRTLVDRVSAFGGVVQTIRANANDPFDFPDTYDAIIFYEAFHHMPAPRELLAHLKRFLTPEGFFAFGAEPITEESFIMPFPWGFRMDGGAISAIRDAGWVEFGFQTGFFISMLSDLGYTAIRTHLPGFTHCDVWIAKPTETR